MSRKPKPSHLARRCIVYVRQSTARQVQENGESALRQYALTEHAERLGWPATSIDLIDEDLGLSGASAEWRSGFQRMAEAVARGTVGAICALEVSRFARSSADWHRLLELCRWTDVLIVDEHSVYDPTDPNDGLLLGFKGQMSEAEKNWLKLRMHGARLNKARRGELEVNPPAGYLWDRAALRFRFDPDEEVQRAVRLVFERFRIDGSIRSAIRYFRQHDLKLPVRRTATGPVSWVDPHPSHVQTLLHHPIYAGAYSYGRTETRPVIREGRLHATRSAVLPETEWKVLLRDRHPAYISWAEYVENRLRLADNHASWKAKGAPREGRALLQGLLLCGRCGSRMRVAYGKGTRVLYLCTSPDPLRGAAGCVRLSAEPIEIEVVNAFLEMAQPAELELCLAVSQEAQRQAAAVDQQWRLRLERARYAATLAERRYKAVDPEHRNVARTIEHEWEQALVDVAEVERAYEEARHARKVEITAADRARILSLARDLPRVWDASTTTLPQRKALLRTLISGVTITPIDVPERATRVQILWEGGEVTERRVERPRKGDHSVRRGRAADRVVELARAGHTDESILSTLVSEGYPGPGGVAWTTNIVRKLRRRFFGSKPAQAAPLRRADGLYSSRGVAEILGVSCSLVTHWTRTGRLTPVHAGGRGKTAWYEIDDAELKRLRARSFAAAAGGAV